MVLLGLHDRGPMISNCVNMYACIPYLDLVTHDMLFLTYMLSCVNPVLLFDKDNDVLQPADPSEFKSAAIALYAHVDILAKHP